MKKEHKAVKQFKQSGIYIDEFNDRIRTGNFKKCLWNAFLNFLFVASILGFFVSSFDLPCNMFVVLGFVAFMSLYMGLLYLNSWFFNLGYIIMPFWIISLAILLYMIVNSGFSAVLNIIFKAVDSEFNLINIREYTEYYKNRYISITVCLCFISIILVIFTNMWVSRTKKLIYPFIFYVSIVEFCIYLNDEFSYIYLGLLVCAFILFVLTNQNDDKALIYKKKYRPFDYKRKLIRLRTGEVEKKGNIIVAAVASFAIFILTFIISSGMSTLYFSRNSVMKDKSDEVVKQVAQYGFLSLFTGVTGSTGLENGNISRNSTVIHDGLTDLVVDFVPYTYNDIYISEYKSTYYNVSQSRWEDKKITLDSFIQFSDKEIDYLEKIIDSDILTKYILAAAYELGIEGSSFASMRIENYDLKDGSFTPQNAVNGGFTLPKDYYYLYNYYPSWNNEDYHKISEKVREVVLNPTASDVIKLNSIKVSAYDGVKVFDLLEYYYQNEFLVNYILADFTFKSMNDDNELYNTIDKICSSNEFKSFYNNYQTNKILYDSNFEYEVIESLISYFQNNYTYSLSPGYVPYDNDPLVYFLKDNKRGYCVHFASSAALILRNLGIPARYVEGYAFGGMDYDDAVVVDSLLGTSATEKPGIPYDNKTMDPVGNLAPYKDVVYDGYNPLNIPNIVELDLTDNNAHAWVEVFIYGVGWVPFEFTVADADAEGEGDLGSIFRRFMQSSQEIFEDEGLANTEVGITGETIEKVLSGGALIIFSTVGILLLAFILFRILKAVYELYLVKGEKRVVNQYRHLVMLIKNYYKSKNKKDKDKYEYYTKLVIAHNDFLNYVVNEFGADEECAKAYINNILEYNYSEADYSYDIELVAEITKQFRVLKKSIKSKYSIFKRFFI